MNESKPRKKRINPLAVIKQMREIERKERNLERFKIWSSSEYKEEIIGGKKIKIQVLSPYVKKY